MNTGNSVSEPHRSIQRAGGGHSVAEAIGVDVRILESSERDEGDSYNLLSLWHTVLKHKWTVIGFFAITLAVSVTSLYLTPRMYRATVLLKIDPESNSKIRKIDDAIGGGDEYPVYDPEFYQTQYELLRSRTLAERVAESLNLGEGDKDADTVSKRYGGIVQGGTTVEPVRNSKLVKLHFDSTNPELAARIANALADTYIKSSLERRYNATADAKNFLEQRIVQVKAKLEDAEHKLYAHAREQGIVNIDTKESQSLLTTQLQEKSEALAQAERERLTAESISRESRNDGGHGSSKILNDSLVQSLKANKAKLEMEYQEKLPLFKPEYPAMVQLQEQIHQINTQIEAEIASVRSALDADYQLALRKEAMLREEVARLKEDVMKRQDTGSDYNILKREVETSRALYDGILQRLKEIGVASGITTNNISIIDPAEVPGAPYKPNPKSYLMAGIFLGLFGGIGLAFLFEKLDDTVRTPRDLEDVRLAMLGVIPFIRLGKQMSETPLHLISHCDPRSGTAEAYRSLRTALTFSTNLGAPKVLHLTSASQGEGKSTSAINLAIGFTQLGQTVLLIDGDMRRPSLHRMLGMDNDKGLSHYLSGEAKPTEVSHAVGIPGLFVIPAGHLPPNPSELLASARMVDLLALAAEKFDRVIIDSPPVMGLADALILSHLAKHTIMVAAAGKTRRSHLTSSLKRLLQGSQANLLGGLLTMFDPSSGGHSYYYNYHYEYAGSHSDTPRLAAGE